MGATAGKYEIKAPLQRHLRSRGAHRDEGPGRPHVRNSRSVAPEPEADEEPWMGGITSKSTGGTLNVPESQVKRSSSSTSSLASTVTPLPGEVQSPYGSSTSSIGLLAHGHGKWHSGAGPSLNGSHSAATQPGHGAPHSHHKLCRDSDLIPVHSIHQAYPFDDTQKKSVVKQERVFAPMQSGHLQKTRFGHATITKLGKLTVHCDECGHLIVDRHDEKLWYCCSRCRHMGRHFDLCARCFEQRGAGGQASHNSATMHGYLPQLMTQSTSTTASDLSWGGTMTHQSSRTGSKESDGVRSQPSPSQRSGKPSFRCLSTEITSGIWTGSVVEGKTSRPAERHLFFFANGSITGSGSEGCQIAGSFKDTHIQWAETYDWGVMDVTAEFKVRKKGKPAMLCGTFSATDGGSGSFSLTAPTD